MIEKPKFSPEFKDQVALGLIFGEKELMEANRDYWIKDKVLSRWKQEIIERAGQVFKQAKPNEQEWDLVELERIIMRMTIQLDVENKYWDNLASHRRKTRNDESAERMIWLFSPGRWPARGFTEK